MVQILQTLVMAGLVPASTYLFRIWLKDVDAREEPGHDGDGRVGHPAYPFFFGSHFSTGPPASRQAAKPPAMWATGCKPMSFAVFAASAERMPPAQWKMNFLSSWKIGLA